MPHPSTADIIPFPVREPIERKTDGSAAQLRLTRALAGLEAAMTEQRAAMAAWRGALDELKASTRSLGDGLQRYRGTLDALGSDVAGLRDQALRLGAWADGALERERGGRPTV